MSPATMQRIDQLATDAVHDLTRAQVFAAGREYVLSHARGPFDRWLWERELARITAEFYEAREAA